MLLYDIEEGKPVSIPRELQNTRNPASTRYYDFILNFLTHNVER